jgi:uncharacterized protein DUF5343
MIPATPPSCAMAKKSEIVSEPKFPYTTEPKALRRLLAEIPKRPKPPKITFETLKAWSVSNNSNSRTAINVLKKLGLLGPAGEPNEQYVEFMKTGTGPAVLGARIKDVYRVLFEHSHAPHEESDEELKKLFHIHSGGGEDAMRLQILTFKALAEFADFKSVNGSTTTGSRAEGLPLSHSTDDSGNKLPPVNVDLHIHLPENKTTRDYEAIIQDIARYIYGRKFD